MGYRSEVPVYSRTSSAHVPGRAWHLCVSDKHRVQDSKLVTCWALAFLHLLCLPCQNGCSQLGDLYIPILLGRIQLQHLWPWARFPWLTTFWSQWCEIEALQSLHTHSHSSSSLSAQEPRRCCIVPRKQVDFLSDDSPPCFLRSPTLLPAPPWLSPALLGPLWSTEWAPLMLDTFLHLDPIPLLQNTVRGGNAPAPSPSVMQTTSFFFLLLFFSNLEMIPCWLRGSSPFCL